MQVPVVPNSGSAAAVKPAETPAIAPPRQVVASPLGLGFGLASIRLDGPRERTTDQPVGIITGTVGGGPAARLVVYVNGEPIGVDPKQPVFELSVPLNPGSNRVRAVAIGPAGVESEDLIRIDYATPPAVVSGAVVLASPADGLTLGAEDPPVVVVEGEITDPAADNVWIVANDRRVQVRVRDGRFRQVLVVSDPLVRLWAEVTPTGGQPQRSRTITVQRAASAASAGVLVVQWPRAEEGFDVEVSATWRAQADRLDAPAQTVTLPSVSKGANGTPPDVFYLRGMKPGVYTLAVRSRGPVPPGDIQSTFYLSDRTGLTARPLGSTRFNGGRVVLAKVLLPYGVVWGQDEWFTGVSESVDTVTKFRVPEGISWIERKGDLP